MALHSPPPSLLISFVLATWRFISPNLSWGGSSDATDPGALCDGRAGRPGGGGGRAPRVVVGRVGQPDAVGGRAADADHRPDGARGPEGAEAHRRAEDQGLRPRHDRRPEAARPLPGDA